jgi:hypothetical protein|tara:strand:- start:1451 stop:1891 length:441 start_codon:yes stop_codon:yes gene_type:complete
MDKIEVSNIFGWLDEITVKKSHPNSFSEASWDKWNSYMIHRYVSMNMGYIDIVNYVQKTNPQSKKQIYTIYREMIPRKKLWLKYIKNEKKRNYKELAEYIAEYLDCGLGEADHYVDILKKEGCKDILFRMGIEDKEVNKLIKEAKL